jgi:chitin disaccharide deacetylase
MPRSLIINADDLGLCRSVNSAIFEVFSAGNLTSATLMVNMPGARDAAERLPQHPGLGVGLHFCLTEGSALAGPSSLTGPDGRFMDRTALARAALKGSLRSMDVTRELIAQLDRMGSLGIRPTHVDSHQHVHMFPSVVSAMLPVLEERGLALRLVDPPWGALRASIGRPAKFVKQLLNRRFSARVRRGLRLRTTDALVSIHDLDHEGPYDAATYAGLLNWAAQGSTVELMVHPYILGQDVLDLYAGQITAKQPFLNRCVAEYEALRGAPVFPQLKHITFADL